MREHLRQRPGDQPLPTVNERPSIQSLVRADLDAREQVGIARYGTPLQPHNGRDAARDLYEELLDAACYARQLLEERGRPDLAIPADAEDQIDRVLNRHGQTCCAQLSVDLLRLFESWREQIDEPSVNAERPPRVVTGTADGDGPERTERASDPSGPSTVKRNGPMIHWGPAPKYDGGDYD